MQKINSPGFERWAKIVNLKEMAKTIMFLQENGLTDLEELEKLPSMQSPKQEYAMLQAENKKPVSRVQAVQGENDRIAHHQKLSAPVIKCKKPPRKKCKIVAEVKGKS